MDDLMDLFTDDELLQIALAVPPPLIPEGVLGAVSELARPLEGAPVPGEATSQAASRKQTKEDRDRDPKRWSARRRYDGTLPQRAPPDAAPAPDIEPQRTDRIWQIVDCDSFPSRDHKKLTVKNVENSSDVNGVFDALKTYLLSTYQSTGRRYIYRPRPCPTKAVEACEDVGPDECSESFTVRNAREIRCGLKADGTCAPTVTECTNTLAGTTKSIFGAAIKEGSWYLELGQSHGKDVCAFPSWKDDRFVSFGNSRFDHINKWNNVGRVRINAAPVLPMLRRNVFMALQRRNLDESETTAIQELVDAEPSSSGAETEHDHDAEELLRQSLGQQVWRGILQRVLRDMRATKSHNVDALKKAALGGLNRALLESVPRYDARRSYLRGLIRRLQRRALVVLTIQNNTSPQTLLELSRAFPHATVVHDLLQELASLSDFELREYQEIALTSTRLGEEVRGGPVATLFQHKTNNIIQKALKRFKRQGDDKTDDVARLEQQRFSALLETTTRIAADENRSTEARLVAKKFAEMTPERPFPEGNDLACFLWLAQANDGSWPTMECNPTWSNLF